MEEKLLTIKQFAELKGVKIQTVYASIDNHPDIKELIITQEHKGRPKKMLTPEVQAKLNEVMREKSTQELAIQKTIEDSLLSTVNQMKALLSSKDEALEFARVSLDRVSDSVDSIKSIDILVSENQRLQEENKQLREEISQLKAHPIRNLLRR